LREGQKSASIHASSRVICGICDEHCPADRIQVRFVGPLASVHVPFGFVMGPNTLEGEDIFNLARSKGEWIIIHKSYYL
jgi:succinate dehydrogenase/fumarate reductase-like Fe-S protein